MGWSCLRYFQNIFRNIVNILMRNCHNGGSFLLWGRPLNSLYRPFSVIMLWMHVRELIILSIMNMIVVWYMKRRPLMGWYTWTDSRHNARHILYHRNWKKGQPWPRCKQNFITIISLSMIFIPLARQKPIQALNSRNFHIAFSTRPSHRM